MAEFILIKNGTHVIARADNATELRNKAVSMIAEAPNAAFEAARIVKRVRTDYTPPSYTVVEEDIP